MVCGDASCVFFVLIRPPFLKIGEKSLTDCTKEILSGHTSHTALANSGFLSLEGGNVKSEHKCSSQKLTC